MFFSYCSLWLRRIAIVLWLFLGKAVIGYVVCKTSMGYECVLVYQHTFLQGGLLFLEIHIIQVHTYLYIYIQVHIQVHMDPLGL